MNSVEYAVYLKTDHWRQLRATKIAVCGRACLRCGSLREIQVHHVNYRNIYDVQLEDLEVLCKRCHKLAHGKPVVKTISSKTRKMAWSGSRSLGLKQKRAQKLSRRRKNRFVRPAGMPYSEYQRIRDYL